MTMHNKVTIQKGVLMSIALLCSMQNSFADTGIIPTVDSLGRNDIGTAYTLTKTNATTGDNVYEISTFNPKTNKINSQFYELNIKDGITSGTRFVNGADISATEHLQHYFNRSHVYTSDYPVGGSIFNRYNTAFMGSVIGDHIKNHCNMTSAGAPYGMHGGSLDNHGTIQSVKGDFIGNYGYSKGTQSSRGGALSNVKGTVDDIGYIGEIAGNFIGNYVYTTQSDSSGGGIYNSGTIDSLKGMFIGNYVTTESPTNISAGGAIIILNGKITELKADFIKNKAENLGGAIYNSNGEITTLEGNFAGNEATNGDGGAIYNKTTNNGITVTDKISVIKNLKSIFFENKAGNDGGAIYNTNGAQIENAKSDFISNQAGNNGGAIYNDSVIAGSPSIVVDGNFINNKAAGLGGAIYSKSDIELLADGHKNILKGNSDSAGNGIYMQHVPHQDAITDPLDDTIIISPEIQEVIPTLTFNTPNNGEWAIYDKIAGTAGLYNVNMTGGGTVSLYNDIKGGNVTLDATTLNTINNKTHVYNVNDFSVKGNSNMIVDFNIRNEKMDRIKTTDPTNNYGGNTGTLNVSKLNFLNDTDKYKASVLFAEPELAHKVLNHGKAEGETHRIITPVRMYDIQYNVHKDDNCGYFEFTSNWNPSVLAAPVVYQTGIQSAMNTTIQYAFNHLDTYTKIPKFDRLALMNNDKYAFASTDFNENSALRLYNLKENRNSNNGVWVRPYAAFESIPLKNGPKVDSITYGTFVGYDSDFHEHKHGWHSVWSTYMGYQGGVVDYKGISANLNGGVLGLTDTFYKNNFWTAVTLTSGAMLADISTMYGHEDATSIAGALATKTGYNFEFKDGKYILQPIFKASYTFANMFDYRNAASVKIDAKPLHTIQLNPSLRFIMNCENGWQPYARVGMVWNLLNETDIDAGNYHLPEMHIKPYVEYGLGIQKLYNHRFTGFAQAMARGGGRNGVAITLGFRYALGREGDEEFKNMSAWEKFKAFFIH